MKHINTLDNSSLEAMMSDFEIRKAVELFSDLDSFLEKYRQCSLLVGDEDFFYETHKYIRQLIFRSYDE